LMFRRLLSFARLTPVASAIVRRTHYIARTLFANFEAHDET
jgi:hypothetical protein